MRFDTTYSTVFINKKRSGTVYLFVIIKRINLKIIGQCAVQDWWQVMIVFIADAQNPDAAIGKAETKSQKLGGKCGER